MRHDEYHCKKNIYKEKKLRTYQKYAGVVIDMQETKLLKPFFGYDEKSVQEIQNFGNVEDVQNESNRWIRGVKLIAR